MATLKTRPNDLSVDAFLASIENVQKQDDSKLLLDLMEKITNEKPVMWGDSIVGFGSYHLKYQSGRELDWMLAGFSPRKQNMTIYMMGGFENQEELLAKIGKAKHSVSCLYVKKLEDIDLKVLSDMIKLYIATVKNRYAEYN